MPRHIRRDFSAKTDPTPKGPVVSPVSQQPSVSLPVYKSTGVGSIGGKTGISIGIIFLLLLLIGVGYYFYAKNKSGGSLYFY